MPENARRDNISKNRKTQRKLCLHGDLYRLQIPYRTGTSANRYGTHGLTLNTTPPCPNNPKRTIALWCRAPETDHHLTASNNQWAPTTAKPPEESSAPNCLKSAPPPRFYGLRFFDRTSTASVEDGRKGIRKKKKKKEPTHREIYAQSLLFFVSIYY